ncbi:MAG: hypothetical protein JG781_2099 [Peptococcaceae bacterium]|jgi:uncharacterized protein YfbU (UPF0304 family)|nr:hypothetical protein [Peptococcaceae bacterium]
MAEELLKSFEELPEDKKRQVIDFVEFLKTKDQKEIVKMMDSIIQENMEALRELSK